jgi:hypothetical protein
MSVNIGGVVDHIRNHPPANKIAGLNRSAIEAT